MIAASRKLLERRIPQYVALYLGVAWGAVQFVHAAANYEVGAAYLDAGDRARALDHLRRAVQVWSDADPAHRPAAEARAKLKQLDAN